MSRHIKFSSATLGISDHILPLRAEPRERNGLQPLDLPGLSFEPSSMSPVCQRTNAFLEQDRGSSGSLSPIVFISTSLPPSRSGNLPGTDKFPLERAPVLPRGAQDDGPMVPSPRLCVPVALPRPRPLKPLPLEEFPLPPGSSLSNPIPTMLPLLILPPPPLNFARFLPLENLPTEQPLPRTLRPPVSAMAIRLANPPRTPPLDPLPP